MPNPTAYSGPPAMPVYIYRRPALAFASQADRGLVAINIAKLGGHADGETDEQAFDRLAAAQMSAWMKHPRAMLVRFEAAADPLVRTMMELGMRVQPRHLDTWRAPADRSSDDWKFPSSTAWWLAMPNFVAGAAP